MGFGYLTSPVILWRNPHAAPLSRVFVANVALGVGGATVLAMTPATVSWPLVPIEAGVLAAWALVLLVVDYLVLRFLFLPQRMFTRRPRVRDVELTPRELEVVRLIADSYTAKEIGEMLWISPKTVDAHRGRILKKLGLRDRVALTRYAIRRGLVPP